MKPVVGPRLSNGRYQVTLWMDEEDARNVGYEFPESDLFRQEMFDIADEIARLEQDRRRS